MIRDLQPIASNRSEESSGPLPASQSSHFSPAALLQIQAQRWWGAIRAGWWVLLLSLILVGGASVLYALFKTPVYRSHAMLWLTSKLNLPGEHRLFSDDTASYMGTQAELIKDSAILSRAFEKMRSKFPKLASITPGTAPEVLPFVLSTTTSTKSGVIKVEAKGSSPESTRAFLAAVIEEYLAVKKSSRQQSSEGAVSSITDQMKEAERLIQKQAAELTAFGMTNNISYLTEQSQSSGFHLSKLAESLSALTTEYRILESLTPNQLKNLANGDEAVLANTGLAGQKTARALLTGSTGPDSASIQVLQQLELLKSKRDELAKVLRPTHSKMLKLNQEISGLEQLLRTLKEEGGTQALAHIDSLKKSLRLQIENLESQTFTWITNAGAASRTLMEHERLKQDRQRAQLLYDSLAGLLQTVDLHNSFDQESMNLLAPASTAIRVSSKKLVVAVGLFLGFVLGAGIIFFREFFNDRVRSLTELSYHLPDEIIGQIPESPPHASQGKAKHRHDPEMHHAFTEAFRSLGISLVYSLNLAETTKPKTILVTSAVPAEGKSTVASNLAASLVQSGSKVLLVDADLRRSSLHKTFGVSLKPGLREVLGKVLPISEAIVPVEVQRLHPDISSKLSPDVSCNLFLLPAGECNIGPSESFLGSEMG